MKITLNKSVYAALPEPIAKLVREWAQARRCRRISVERAYRFFIDEDATYTAFSPDCQSQKKARAAGEWAGPTGLRPSAECPLPLGCTVVETGWFLGKPHLTIFHNGILHLPSLRDATPLLGTQNFPPARRAIFTSL